MASGPIKPNGLLADDDIAGVLRPAMRSADGPRYAALTAAMRDAISSGVFAPGMKLPAERELAGRLGVSRSTVTRAYDELRETAWLRSRTGSGTYVRDRSDAAGRQWLRDLVDGGPRHRPLAPEVVNLTSSKPSPFVEQLQQAIAGTADAIPALAAQVEYATQGLPALRQTVARAFTERGLPTDLNQVLITTGAQQAINLVARMHIAPGARVIVESPTYLGALDALRVHRARLLSFDPHQPDALERLERIVLQARPSLLFLMPTCHTVTGRVTTRAAREAIGALAERHQLPVIDDDIFADLTFEARPLPPLAAFAEDAPIFTVGSMSKLVWNGLRIGWLRVPQALVTRLARLKGTDDLGTSLVAQLTAGSLLAHRAALAAHRRAEARDAVRRAGRLLREHLPSWSWEAPQGGRSLWIRVPSPEASAFAQTALRHGVLVTSGDVYAPDGSHPDRIRLMPVQPPADLAEGVRRLGLAWEEHRAAAST